MSLHESCSSHVQRVGRKDVVKSSKIDTGVKEVEGKSALDGIQMLSGGFITESRMKCFEIMFCSSVFWWKCQPLKPWASLELVSLARFPQWNEPYSSCDLFVSHTQSTFQKHSLQHDSLKGYISNWSQRTLRRSLEIKTDSMEKEKKEMRKNIFFLIKQRKK